MLTSGEDLVEALFGGAGALSWPEILFRIVAAALVVAFVVTQRNRLVVMLVSPDVARTAGINVRRLNLLYLLTFVLTIALGLRYLGVLLMGELIITPAATTKRLANNSTQMLLIAVGVAVAATVVGTWLASGGLGRVSPVPADRLVWCSTCLYVGQEPEREGYDHDARSKVRSGNTDLAVASFNSARDAIRDGID